MDAYVINRTSIPHKTGNSMKKKKKKKEKKKKKKKKLTYVNRLVKPHHGKQNINND